MPVWLARRFLASRRRDGSGGIRRPGWVARVCPVVPRRMAGLTVVLAAVPEPGAGQPRGDVDGEADAVTNTLGLMLLAPKLASSPPSAAATAKTTDSAVTTSGLGGQALGGGGRGDREAEHEQRADHLGGAGHGQGEHDQEHRARGARTGTPRASATSGSTDANSSGRYPMAMTTTTTTPIATSMSSWSLLTPKMLPNKMLVAAVAKPW